MRRRPLGNTGMKVTELCLGTWGLSGDGYGPVNEAEQDRVIDRARALGIRLFETADSYAHGAMERRLGERLGKDEKVRFVTKVGTDRDAGIPQKCFEPEYLKKAVDASRKRLGRDVLDVVLLHNPSEAAMEKGEATNTLAELAEAGTVRAWGVSAGSVEVAREAIGRGAKVLSIALNVFHGRDLVELRDDVEREEVGLLAHSVLAYGLLAGHWAPGRRFPDGEHRAERWTDEELRRRVRQLDALRPVVGGDVLTLRSGALRWVLSQDVVSSVVLGPRSSLQLDQLVREAGKGPPYLEEDKLSGLEARLEEVGAF